MTIQALFGIAAGILALAAYPAYVWSIFEGTTRPNRATWWILTLASGVLAASYYAEGARNTIWIALAYVFGNLIIALLSLRYGEGKWSTLDRLCLTAALLSAALWWFLDEPLIALLVNIAIDFLGIIPTIYKAYAKPTTESRIAWAMDAIASTFAILAIERWTFALAVYPFYLLIANCGLAYLLITPRGKNKLSSNMQYTQGNDKL